MRDTQLLIRLVNYGGSWNSGSIKIIDNQGIKVLFHNKLFYFR